MFHRLIIICCIAGFISISHQSEAVTWTGTYNADWHDTLNWNPISSPDGVAVTFDDTATGTTADISAADVTPTSVMFNNSTKDFTITGNNGISGPAVVTKQGTGKVTMTSANSYIGATTINGGRLELGTIAQAPVLTGVGGVDIQGGKLVLDYTSTAPDVKTPLKAGYASYWAAGQIRDTTAGASGLCLGWTNDTTNRQVTIMATLRGDANLDGSLTGADLSKLLSKFNQVGDWNVGDFNYDGSVTGADLSILLWGMRRPVLPIGGMTTAPEPSTLVLLVTGLSGLIAVWRWRKRTA